MDRKGNVKWILFVLLVIAMLGCTDKESYLSGVWRSKTEDTKWCTLDFMSDHTGIFEKHKAKESEWTLMYTADFIWTLLEDGRVKIEPEKANARPIICNLKDDGFLLCKEPGNPIVVFTKERN